MKIPMKNGSKYVFQCHASIQLALTIINNKVITYNSNTDRENEQ